MTHCHKPGDCGPGSYTTDVGGGDTGGGSNSGSWGGDPGTCDASCQGPVHIRPAPLPKTGGGSGNPKIAAPPAAVPAPTTTSCNDRCRTDKELIKSHLRDQQDTFNNWSTLIGDAIALGADIVAAIAEFVAKQARSLILEIVSILVRVGVIVGDLAKLGLVFHMPTWLSDVLQSLKVAAGIIDAVGSWFNFLDFGALIANGVQKVAATVAPKLIAFILSVANVGVLTGTIGVPKGADAFYWQHQRDIVDGYNDTQALNVCVQDNASHPGMC